MTTPEVFKKQLLDFKSKEQKVNKSIADLNLSSEILHVHYSDQNIGNYTIYATKNVKLDFYINKLEDRIELLTLIKNNLIFFSDQIWEYALLPLLNNENLIPYEYLKKIGTEIYNKYFCIMHGYGINGSGELEFYCDAPISEKSQLEIKNDYKNIPISFFVTGKPNLE